MASYHHCVYNQLEVSLTKDCLSQCNIVAATCFDMLTFLGFLSTMAMISKNFPNIFSFIVCNPSLCHEMAQRHWIVEGVDRWPQTLTFPITMTLSVQSDQIIFSTATELLVISNYIATIAAELISMVRELKAVQCTRIN
jgi:hypothetical protein